MAKDKFNHVLCVLTTPTQERYATDWVVDSVKDFEMPVKLSHTAKMIVLDCPGKTFKQAQKFDDRLKDYTEVSVSELVSIYANAYPQSPIEWIKQDED